MAGKRFHFDRRIPDIVTKVEGMPGHLLLTTRELAEWFGVSTQWVEIARCKGTGPPFLRITPTRIRYRLSDVREWLDGRICSSTKENRKSDYIGQV